MVCVRTRVQGHTNEVAGVSVTPDGRKAISASVDNTLRVWDLASMACVGVLEVRACVSVWVCGQWCTACSSRML